VEKVGEGSMVELNVTYEQLTNELNTIVNDNSSWAILSHVVYPTSLVRTEYVYFDGDSTIGKIAYKKVFSCDDRLHENIKYEGLIREQENKTYFISANTETERMLYNFSLEEGMNFEYWDSKMQKPKILHVKSVDFVKINGFHKKRIQITTNSNAEWILDTWVEEIGSLSGILYPCYGAFGNGVVRHLLCYFQNNELIYKNANYSECYYDRYEDIVE